MVGEMRPVQARGKRVEVSPSTVKMREAKSGGFEEEAACGLPRWEAGGKGESSTALSVLSFSPLPHPPGKQGDKGAWQTDYPLFGVSGGR